MWCHVRHLNLDGKNLRRISGKDIEISKSSNYSGVDFPLTKKDYSKIEVLNKICINVFCYEKVVYPVYLSDKSFKDSMDLLLVSNHYVYVKDFNRLVFNRSKNKNKKWFCKSCLQCLVVKRFF